MNGSALILILAIITHSCMKNDPFHSHLGNYLRNIESEFTEIPESRIETLEQLGDYVISTLNEQRQVRLVFICTHNSRRSQFGQIWAWTAARFYGIQPVCTFSGGTNSTAFNPHALAALERTGFSVEQPSAASDNPRYYIKYGENLEGLYMFSKRYDHDVNPDAAFCAIMVCSDADEACPFVPGAEERISMPYDDPKIFDGTGQESAKYDERCRQIAREICYMFHYVERKLGMAG